jgi:hypothetical protein
VTNRVVSEFRDENAIEVVELLRTIDSQVHVRPFEIGRQYSRKVEPNPFGVLSSILRERWIRFCTAVDLRTLLQCMAHEDGEIARVYGNQADVLYGYKAALEVIINEKLSIEDELLGELAKEVYNPLTLEVLKLIHNPTRFITRFGRALVDRLFVD